MKAVVMAGGQGSRLRPLTINRPKPMVPLVDKPVVVHIVELLKRHGITKVVLTLQYMADMMQDYFGDGSAMDMDFQYSIEEIPLGTAGSVKNAQKHLDETFIVISGDAVTDIDLGAVIDFHQRKGALATLTLYRVPNPLEYGVVIIDDQRRIQEFQEAPETDVRVELANRAIMRMGSPPAGPTMKGIIAKGSQNDLPMILK